MPFPLPNAIEGKNVFVDQLETYVVNQLVFEIDTFMRYADQARYYIRANTPTGITFQQTIGNYTETSPVFLRLKVALEEGRGYSDVHIADQYVVFTVERDPEVTEPETPTE